MRESLVELAVSALHTDGEHHKQWYLEQILLGLVGPAEFQNLFMVFGNEQWEKGICP